jgi:curved DNA-binding protein CbpA
MDAPRGDDDALVRAVLDAVRAKDYFTALRVRAPDCDSLGRAVWDVTDAELNRAFRKASLRVHPDKNTSSDARLAFDALGEAYKVFKDAGMRAEVLRKAAEEVWVKKCKADPELMRTRAKAQERADAEAYAETMRKQMEEKRKLFNSHSECGDSKLGMQRRGAQRGNGRRRGGAEAQSDDDTEALEKVARDLEEAEAKAEANQHKKREAVEDFDDEDVDGVAFTGIKRKPKKRFMF